MPTGITGLARPREWDATLPVEIPELEGQETSEFSLVAFDHAVVGPELSFPGAAERVAEALDEHLDRPYEALVVRRSTTGWMAGGRRTHAELIHLAGVEATTIDVALGLGGEVSAAVDGTPVEGLVDPPLDAALREIERRGRARFQAFAARADNLDGERWQLTLDPL